MASPELIRTEQRLAEVDALQQTISSLRQDLQAYSTALRRELEALRQEAAAFMPLLEPAPEVEPEDAVEPPALTDDSDDSLFRPLEEEIPQFRSFAAKPAPPPARAPRGRPAPEPPDEPAAMEEPPRKPMRSPFEMDDETKIGGKPVSVMISDGTASSDPLSGWVIDRPSGGFKILVDDEIPIGSVISVKPNVPSPNAQWVNVCVKSKRPERHSWIISCTFVERPPWAALALFNG
ncbi:MAG: hypothetical protein JNM56_32025 [Planctomycetia bacterium]|nr:hypothetical protein [Planctomycetia bacterium]